MKFCENRLCREPYEADGRFEYCSQHCQRQATVKSLHKINTSMPLYKLYIMPNSQVICFERSGKRVPEYEGYMSEIIRRKKREKKRRTLS